MSGKKTKMKKKKKKVLEQSVYFISLLSLSVVRKISQMEDDNLPIRPVSLLSVIFSSEIVIINMLRHNGGFIKWGELRKKRFNVQLAVRTDRCQIEEQVAEALRKRDDDGKQIIRKLLMSGKLAEKIVMWTGVVQNESFILDVVLEWSTESVILRSLIPLLREALFKMYCGSVSEYMKNYFIGISRIESLDVCNQIIEFCGCDTLPELRLVNKSLYVASSAFYSEQKLGCITNNAYCGLDEVMASVLYFVLSRETSTTKTLPKVMSSSIVTIYGHMLFLCQSTVKQLLPQQTKNSELSIKSICDTFKLSGDNLTMIETVGELLYCEEDSSHITVLVDNVLQRYEGHIVEAFLYLNNGTAITFPDTDNDVLYRILGSYCRIGNTQFFIDIIKSDDDIWEEFFIDGLLSIFIHSGQNPTLVPILSAALYVGCPSLIEGIISALEGNLQLMSVDSENQTPVAHWAAGGFQQHVLTRIFPFMSPICLLKKSNPDSTAPLSLLLQQVRNKGFEGDSAEVLRQLAPFLMKTSYPLYWCFHSIHVLRNKRGNVIKNLEVVHKMFEYFTQIGCGTAAMPIGFVAPHLPLSAIEICDCCSEEGCLMYPFDHLLGTAHCPALKDMLEFKQILNNNNNYSDKNQTVTKTDTIEEEDPVDDWELLA